MEDEYLDELNENSRQEAKDSKYPCPVLPWDDEEYGNYASLKHDQLVAQALNPTAEAGGATVDDAVNIPLIRYNALLMYRSAEVTAEPARLRYEREKQDLEDEARKNRDESIREG